MLLSYQDCIKEYGSDFMLKKRLVSGSLFMLERGVYSTESNVPEIEIIMFKYPNAVCTGESAFYYHSLTEIAPEHFHLATKRTTTRFRDPRVEQSFLRDDIFDAGITEISYEGSWTRTYSMERMLVELMRFRAKIPMDHYKEIIRNYRTRVYQMDLGLVGEYAALFRSGAKLMRMIQLEVL